MQGERCIKELGISVSADLKIKRMESSLTRGVFAVVQVPDWAACIVAIGPFTTFAAAQHFGTFEAKRTPMGLLS
jgi:hypothetical protein